MSLKEALKEMKEQLEKEELIEEKPDDEVEIEEPEPEEKKPEEAPAEEEKPKEEEKPEEEEKLDNNGYRRLRREKAAAEKLASDRETEIAELRAKLAAPKDDEAEEAPRISSEMEEIVRDHRMGRAEREFQTLEAKFSANTPDYNAVSTEYALALAQSIRIQNPRMSNNQVAEETKKSLLMKASHFVNKGFDPIEELYNEAKDLGFTGKSSRREEPKEEEKEEIKPDMRKVADNRKKSTGMTSSGGKSEGQITKQAAMDLTIAEWKKLPASEKRRLMSS